MHIIDTFEQVRGMAAEMNGGFSLPVWEKYAQAIAPGFAQKVLDDVSSYDFELQVLPVLLSALSRPERLAQAHQSFLRAVHRLPERLVSVFGWDGDCTIILYFGLCSGAGWATELQGRPAVLLGLEKICELSWHTPDKMEDLLYHELGHIWHSSLGTPPELSEDEPRAMRQLHSEGVAMVFEQLLCGDPTRFHQDENGWLDWCRAHRAALHREYLRRAECGESIQDFYGDWCRYHGHADVGYYLGCDFVRWLMGDGPLHRAARLDPRELLVPYRQFVSSL